MLSVLDERGEMLELKLKPVHGVTVLYDASASASSGANAATAISGVSGLGKKACSFSAPGILRTGVLRTPSVSLMLLFAPAPGLGAARGLRPFALALGEPPALSGASWGADAAV